MQRQGYIYEKVCDIENIKEAIRRSAEKKREYRSVKRILNNLDKYALDIQAMLLAEHVELGHDRHMERREGPKQKVRQISVPCYYPDQIIHWCVMLPLQAIFTKGMYEYSVGNVPGRGGIYGKNYIEKALRNDRTLRHVFQCDISKFYQSINQDKLKWLLRKKIKDRRVIALLDQIIDHGGESGLPIGYYTSQWLGNFYLEEFDHYIKQELKVKYYVRNVDDMLMLDTNKRKLHKVRKAVEEYFNQNGYGLTLKRNWQVYPIDSRPIDYLGFKFYRDHTELRNYILYDMTRVIGRIERRGRPTVRQARSALSRMGWLHHIANGKNYYLKYIKPKVKKGKLTKIVSEEDKRNGKNKKGIQHTGSTCNP